MDFLSFYKNDDGRETIELGLLRSHSEALDANNTLAPSKKKTWVSRAQRTTTGDQVSVLDLAREEKPRDRSGEIHVRAKSHPDRQTDLDTVKSRTGPKTSNARGRSGRREMDAKDKGDTLTDHTSNRFDEENHKRHEVEALQAYILARVE